MGRPRSTLSLSLVRTLQLSRVRCVLRLSMRPETTGGAAQRRAERTSTLCKNCFICVENLRDVRNPLVDRQLLDHHLCHPKLGPATTPDASPASPTRGRADGSCKFGSRTGQPHVVLHALFLQLSGAPITETTAVEHNVTSPALLPVNFTRHGDKGTQLHKCASDSLTSRWAVLRGRGHRRRRFVVLRASTGLAGLFTGFGHGCALANPVPPIIVGRASPASALAFAGSSSQLLRIGLFSTSVILHFLARYEVPFRFFGLDIWATESKTRFLSLIWSRPHTFAKLWISASAAGLEPALPNKGSAVSRVRTVVLVNTSSTSPSSRKVAILMPCGTLLFETKNALQRYGIQTYSTHCECSNLIANARELQGGRELGFWFFLSATNHIRLVPRKARLSNSIGSTTLFCPCTVRLLWL